MAYIFDNSVLTGNLRGSVALYQLKELLQLAGWTVVASGDGAGTYAAGSDVITDVTDAAGANRFNNSRAWICLQQPPGGSGVHAGTRQIVIQRGDDADGGNNDDVRLVYSAGGTAVLTACDSNTVPTFSDEYCFLGGGTPAAPTFGILFTNLGGPVATNCCAGGAAENFSFALTQWTVSPGYSLGTLLYFDGLQSFVVGDPDPVVVGATTNGFTGAAPYSTDGEWAYGDMGAGMVQMCIFPDDWGAYGYPVNARTNEDDLHCVFYVRRGVGGGYKGHSSLWRRGLPSRTAKSTYTETVTGDRIRFGGNPLSGYALIGPWDNSAPA